MMNMKIVAAIAFFVVLANTATAQTVDQLAEQARQSRHNLNDHIWCSHTAEEARLSRHNSNDHSWCSHYMDPYLRPQVEANNNTNTSTDLGGSCPADTPTPAEDRSVSGEYETSTGTSRLGAKLIASAEVEQTSSGRAGIEGNLRIRARLFGNDFEALRIQAISEVNDGVAKNEVTLYTGGFAVFSMSASSGYSWEPTNNEVWMEKNRSFYAGAFLLNAGTRVGGTVYGSLNLGVNVTGAGVEGRIGSNVWADVTVGLDLVFYRAGVQVKATIMHGWWEADAVVSFWGMSGEFGYHLQPLQIDLNLVIQRMGLKRKGYRYVRVWRDWQSLTLVTWTCEELKKIYLTF